MLEVSPPRTFCCRVLNMNLLRYQAIPASGISLVKELLFLLLVLIKITYKNTLNEQVSNAAPVSAHMTKQCRPTFVSSCALARLSTAMAKKTFSRVSDIRAVQNKHTTLKFRVDAKIPPLFSSCKTLQYYRKTTRFLKWCKLSGSFSSELGIAF